MRVFVSTLICMVVWAGTAKAAIYTLPLNGVFTISGSFFSGESSVMGNVSISGRLPILPLQTNDVSEAVYYLVQSNVPGAWNALSLYASNLNGDHSGRYLSSSANFSLFSGAIGENFTVSTFGTTAKGFQQNPFDLSEIAGLSLTLSLPDRFVVTAVPEPSTWALILFGFAGVGYKVYRGKKQVIGMRTT